MLSFIALLLFSHSILARDLERAASSVSLDQDSSTSTSESISEITVEAQAGGLNFSGIIPLVSPTFVSIEPTVAPSASSSPSIPTFNGTVGGNGTTSLGSLQPTAAGSSLVFNNNPAPHAPTASLIPFTSATSPGPRLSLSQVALLFFLGAMQM